MGAFDSILERLRDAGGSLFAPSADEEPSKFEQTMEPPSIEESLRHYLPYDSYREADQIFVNLGSLGFCLEVSPQVGADKATTDVLHSIFTMMPPGTGVQFALFASPHIHERLDAYVERTVQDRDAATQAAILGRAVPGRNVFRVLARMHRAALKKGAFDSLSPSVPLLLRDFRLVMSVTVPGHINNYTLLDELVQLRESALTTLRSAGFGARIMNAEDLVNWVADIVNPQRMLGQRVHLHYRDGREIRYQCVDEDTYTDARRMDRLRFTKVGQPECEVEARFYGVKSYPTKFALSQMGTLIGDLFDATRQYPCPFMITLSVMVPDAQKKRSQVLMKSVKASKDAKSEVAEFSPGMAEKKNALDLAMRAIQRGERMVDIVHQIAVFSRPQDAPRCAKAMQNLWQARNFDVIPSACVQTQSLLLCLPMTLSKSFYSDLVALKRPLEVTSGNAIHMAPLIAESRGSPTEVLIGAGRRGQVVTLDFFDNKIGGKNVAIVAATGQGKSVLLQYIAVRYRATGSLVRAFERGRSFEKICERVEGQYVRFGTSSRICVNPFSMVSDPVLVDGVLQGGIDQDLQMIQPLIAKMASPNVPLDMVVYASLERVIKRIYEKKGRSMTMTDVRDVYATGATEPDAPPEARYKDLAILLTPFCKGGKYERYFDGPATLDLSNEFLVFETEDLAADNHLRGVVQMILLYYIVQEMFQDRTRRKVFIMDEAKEALKGDSPDDKVLNDFIEALYTRIRKYGGSAITATQDVQHYYASAAGATAFNQSDFIIMGGQSEASIAAAARNEQFPIDGELRRLLISIQSEAGYSEWYVSSKIFRGVFRLFVDPTSLLLFSNDPENNPVLDRKMAEGKDVMTAIREVLAERGVVVAEE
jgi:conjugal transfer ATP-binding protein TraC